MDLGTEMDSFAQALVDTGWKPVVGEAAVDPARTRQPCSSGGYSGHSIRNPIILQIQTASKLDLVPGKSMYTLAIKAGKGIYNISNCVSGGQWVLKKIGGGSRGLSGRRVWDPGGGREESLSMARRWRKVQKRAGWGVMEKDEQGELAGRQAFGF